MIVDPLNYARGVGDDDVSFLRKMKKLEKEKDLVTIKSKYYEIKTTNPERYSDFQGEFIFSVNRKMRIKPSLGKIISSKDGVYTISANSYECYKQITQNL